jgi:hypothetical protein
MGREARRARSGSAAAADTTVRRASQRSATAADGTTRARVAGTRAVRDTKGVPGIVILFFVILIVVVGRWI